MKKKKEKNKTEKYNIKKGNKRREKSTVAQK